jgi:RNA:NAD 2'-phosphotransferase (TPT1/KptA family)
MSASSVAAGIGLLLELIEQAARVSAVIRRAQAEGREVTKDELAQIVAENDAARQALVDAINRAS